MKITVQELKNIIDTKPAKERHLVDVRTLSEYINCRIKGALLIPLQHLDDLHTPLRKDRDIYVISSNGRRAEEFSRKLDALGYRSFYVEGGLAAWYKSGFPVEQSSEQSCSNENLPPVFNIQIRLNVPYGMRHYFDTIIGALYFFEKLGVNVKFLYGKEFSLFGRSVMYFFRKLGVDVRFICSKELSFLERAAMYFFEKLGIDVSFFEESAVIVSEEHRSEEFVDFPRNRPTLSAFQFYADNIASDCDHQIISRLSINQNLRKQADEWCAENFKGDWVGVHYRGTDTSWKSDYIGIDTYIACLKERVDKHCDIFACSDQAQFIDRIHEAFPGRVFSRDIPRSYDKRTLHNDHKYKGRRQGEDALIDILILAKAERIYKTTGRFTGLAKYFNPSVEIIKLPKGKVVI